MRPRKGGSDGLRGLPGLPGPPGLSGPGARPGKGEETGCRACLGFPGLPAFLTQGCGWGTGRRWFAGPSRAFRASRPGGAAENKGKGPRGGPAWGRFVWRRRFGPRGQPGNGRRRLAGPARVFRAFRPGGMDENKGKGPRGGPGGGRFVWRRRFRPRVWSGKGGDGLRGLPGFPGPPGLPGPGVRPRTKEEAHVAGLAEGALPGGGGIKGRRPAGPSGFGIRG